TNTNDAVQYGLFVPTTNVWDPSPIFQLPESEELKLLLVRLYQNLNTVSLALNLKESGYYDTQEFVTGKVLFPNPDLNSSSQTTPIWRPICRITVDFGALPNT